MRVIHQKIAGVIAALVCLTMVQNAWAVREPGPSEQKPGKSLQRGERALAPDALQPQTLLPTELPGAQRDEQAIVKALKTYLQDHTDWLGGVSPSSLTLHHIASIPARGAQPAMVYVQFIQQYEGLDVEGSYVRFAVKLLPGRSVLMSGQASVYPTLSMPARAVQVPRDVRVQAAQALRLDPTKVTPKKESKRVRYIEGRWRRVHEFLFAESKVKAVVDEDRGASWTEDEWLYATVEGRVQGRGVLSGPYVTGANLDTLNLKDLAVQTVGGSTSYTDSSGAFNFPTQTTSTTLSANLLGHWVQILLPFSSTQPHLSVTAPATPGIPVTLLFNPTGSDEFPTAQVNGYYHIEFIHDWIKARLPAPAPGTAGLLDVLGNVVVNLPFTCNAGYNPTNQFIGFFESGPLLGDPLNRACPNSAYDTVAYHEYGHFVDDLAGGITSGGLSEGWGDTFASYATGQPIIGKDFFGPGQYIRTADNTYQYPMNQWGEAHDLGQAWAGFAWHLRQNLITQYGQTTGAQTAESLIVPLILANSATIPQAVSDLVVADDNGGDLSTGTPHLAAIQDAARRHNLPVNVPLAQITSPAEGTVLRTGGSPVAILGVATGTQLSSYQLFYGYGGAPSSWTAIGGPVSNRVEGGGLGTWTLAGLTAGTYSLKLVVTMVGGVQFESVVHVALEDALRQITNQPPDAGKPATSGNWIAYSDNRTGTWDLYAFNVVTNTERKIATTAAQAQLPVAISGHWVAWVDTDKIFLYDLNIPASSPQQLAQGYEVAISGNRLVYTQGGVLYLYDVVARSTRQLGALSGVKSSPAISGDRIVWEDSRNGNQDIYLYDLATETERQITTNPADQLSPVISGDQIVWVDRRNGTFDPISPVSQLNGNQDLYAFDLARNIEWQVTSHPANQWNPTISGDRIAWADLRNGNCGGAGLSEGHCNFDIYVYDLAIGMVQQVTAQFSDQVYPSLSGNRVVWSDQRNGPTDIFWYQLPQRKFTVPVGQLFQFVVRPSDTDSNALTFAANPVPSGAVFKMLGDVNHDGRIDQGDVVALINCTGSNPVLPPVECAAADVDRDGQLTQRDSDLITSLTFGRWPISYIFAWAPTAGQVGNYTITFTITHPSGYTDTETVTITVVNAAPTLSPIANQTVPEGQPLEFRVRADDADGNLQGAITAAGLPAGAEFIPLGDLNGDGLVNQTDYNLLIQYATGSLTPSPEQQSLADLNGDGQLNSVDAVILNWIAFNQTRVSRFRWTPSTTQAGSYPLAFTILDAGGLSASQTVTITVQETSLALAGTIRDQAGHPVSGVSVKLSGLGRYPDHRSIEALTDAQGRYVLFELQTTQRIQQALAVCQQSSACLPVRATVRPRQTQMRFVDSHSTLRRPSSTVTFDPKNLHDATGVDFTAVSR